MNEHRAAVSERLVDQEAEGLRKLNFGRDQILTRLWELATLSHEVTRGSIAGQIKALTMIVAIEGLIPDRRLSPSAQPAAPPVKPQIYEAAWLRKQQQAAGEESGDPVAAAQAQPGASQVAHPDPAPEPAPTPAPKPAPDAPPPPPDRNLDRDSSLTDSLIQQRLRVPGTTDSVLAALLDSASSPRQPFSIKKNPFARRR
jgi:hypothetical protein